MPAFFLVFWHRSTTSGPQFHKKRSNPLTCRLLGSSPARAKKLQFRLRWWVCWTRH